MTLRTDREPLTRRLHLPAQVRDVRWVAVSSVTDTGGVPGPADFYDVYAFIDLEPQAWAALEQSAGRPPGRATVSIPESVAAILIPNSRRDEFKRSDDVRQVEGPALDPASLAADAKTEVKAAVRAGDALVVQMRVR